MVLRRPKKIVSEGGPDNRYTTRKPGLSPGPSLNYSLEISRDRVTQKNNSFPCKPEKCCAMAAILAGDCYNSRREASVKMM